MEEQSRVPGTLELSTLEAGCRSEIEHACLEDAAYAPFSFELLRRATSQGNQQAWEAWRRCFGAIVSSWLRRHPRAELVCYFDSEEHCLARTFECFRQVMTAEQLPARSQLSTLLRYLQACLNGVLLDALRSKARPQGIPLQEPADPEEQPEGESPPAHQVWVHIQTLFHDAREQRVAYLLFDCNLSQEEIFCLTPQEFKDVLEIRHLRCEILRGILHHADFVR